MFLVAQVFTSVSLSFASLLVTQNNKPSVKDLLKAIFTRWCVLVAPASFVYCWYLILSLFLLISRFSSPRIYGFIMELHAQSSLGEWVNNWACAPLTTPGSIRLHCWCNTRLDGVFSPPDATHDDFGRGKWSNSTPTIIGNCRFLSIRYKALYAADRESASKHHPWSAY